jgi:hypothetical protein
VFTNFTTTIPKQSAHMLWCLRITQNFDCTLLPLLWPLPLPQHIHSILFPCCVLYFYHNISIATCYAFCDLTLYHIISFAPCSPCCGFYIYPNISIALCSTWCRFNLYHNISNAICSTNIWSQLLPQHIQSNLLSKVWSLHLSKISSAFCSLWCDLYLYHKHSVAHCYT